MLDPNVAKPKYWRGDRRGWGAFLTIFLILIPAPWALLIAWNMEHGSISGGFNGQATYLFLNPSYLASFCLAPTSQTGIWTDVAMWGVMSAGMMLPTAAPIINTYFTLTAGQPLRIHPSNIWGLVGGYLAIWLIFSAGAGLAQGELARLGLLSVHGMSVSAPLSATLLLAAGLYQFSAIKAACLSRCRSPLAFLMSEWRDGLAGALRMGMRHGLDCLGCCWALMLLAFVGGTMNLMWMGLATGLMALEKLPSIGRPLTKPVGALLIGCAAYVVWIDFTAV